MTRSDKWNRAPMNRVPGLQPEPTGRDWRTALHQLNNIFASIHSSLDLALAHPRAPQTPAFLAQARASAMQGAELVNDLRLSAVEPAGRASGSPPPEPRPNGLAERLVAAQPATLEGSERILLAEDDESVRLLVRAVLSYRGYEVTEAHDGEDAVKLFRQKGPFDLVILDHSMPKLDGPAALEQIRAVDPRIRALGLSGLVPEGGQEAQPAGTHEFDARLSKPFDNTELVVTVRLLLDRCAQPPSRAAHPA